MSTATVVVATALDWPGALDGFKAHCRRRRLRYTTTNAHLSHLRALARLVPAGPADVTPTDVLLWLEERGASKRNAWNSGQAFFTWALRTGLVATSPIASSQRARRTPRSALLAFPEAWQEPVTAYVRTLTSLNRTTRTIEVRLSYLRNLAAVHPHPWTVTYDDLTGWLAARPDWSAETRKAARSSVVGFYREAVNRELIASSPAERLGKVKMPRAVPRPAPTDALQLALLEADDRGRLLILLAAYAGLRAHEVAKVYPARDVIEGVLYVTGKGGHQRIVPLHPLITQALQAELERRRGGQYGTGYRRLLDPPDPDGGYLFPSPLGGPITAGHVSVLLSRALPDGWTAHTLRHRFASEAFAAVLDIRAVQELLGHASPTTTARYTAVPAGHLLAAVMGVR